MASQTTESDIVKALVKLVGTYELKDITVLMIAEKAGVSRQTFYNHFPNVFAVFEWAIREKVETAKIRKSVRPSIFNSITDWGEALYSLKKLTLAYYNSNYRPDFEELLFSSNIDNSRGFIYATSANLLSPRDMDFAARFIAHAYVGVVMDWIDSGMTEPFSASLESMKNIMKLVLKDEFLKYTAPARR